MSKYVDIGVDEGIGLKDGSDVDNYMGWNQFAPNVNPTLWNIIIEDDFLIRGSRHIDGGAFLLNGTTSQTMKLQPWDLLIHGPWRLSSTTQLVLNGFVIVEGAILACIEDSSGVEITNGKFQDPPLDIPVCDVINTAIISPRYICFESGNYSEASSSYLKALELHKKIKKDARPLARRLIWPAFTSRDRPWSTAALEPRWRTSAGVKT